MLPTLEDEFQTIAVRNEPTIVAALLADLPKPASDERYGSGFSVAPVTDELLDAWVRMLRLMERPQDVAALAPAYERELLYRVLQGPLGWMIRDIAAPNTALSRVSASILWIRENFACPLRVEAMAAIAALSVSAFHRHFKAVTALSPLQYQKRVRLLHARSRLVAGEGNITSVAFSVGYESATQFSREYARFFGLPPSRDAKRIAAYPSSSSQSSPTVCSALQGLFALTTRLASQPPNTENADDATRRGWGLHTITPSSGPTASARS